MAPDRVPTRSETTGHDTWRAQPLLLEGSPYQRGLAHGEALRDPIQTLVRLWQEGLERDFEQGAREVIQRFLAGTDFVSAMRTWTPGLLDEIRGIAQGAGLGFDTMLAYQLLDEMWNNAAVVVGEHCSSLGLPAGGGEPACLAQTVDVERFRDGFQVLLHIRHPDSDLESLVLTCAGLVGFNGVNNKNIGLCVNTLLQLNPSRDGLPVAAVVAVSWSSRLSRMRSPSSRGSGTRQARAIWSAVPRASAALSARPTPSSPSSLRGRVA
jgi:isopenicillin-N N-acyltransferase-like protein